MPKKKRHRIRSRAQDAQKARAIFDDVVGAFSILSSLGGGSSASDQVVDLDDDDDDAAEEYALRALSISKEEFEDLFETNVPAFVKKRYRMVVAELHPDKGTENTKILRESIVTAAKEAATFLVKKYS